MKIFQKKYLLFNLLLFLPILSYSQVGIGTTTIDKSAVLEIKSSEQGFLMPRMTTLQKQNIANPTDGLMVYSTNSCANGGMSIYSEGQWKMMPECPDIDFDDDGIPNNLDIDDDNDGILDILEMTNVSEKLIHPNLTFRDEWTSSSPTTINMLAGWAYPSSPGGTTSTVFYENLRGFRVQPDDEIIQIRTFQNGDNGGNLGSFTINIASPSETTTTGSLVSANPLVIDNIDDDIVFHIKVTTLNGIITDINKIQAGVYGIEDTSAIITVANHPTVSDLFIISMDKTAGDKVDFRMDILDEYVTQYEINIEFCAAADQFKIPLTRSLLSIIAKSNRTQLSNRIAHT
ncbi:MAG: hypothetical protein ACPGSD_17835, partial [Flavobacteriales bacterium]